MTTVQVSLVCFTAFLIAACISGCRAYETKRFVDGQYCQGSLPGQSGVFWVHCEIPR